MVVGGGGRWVQKTFVTTGRHEMACTSSKLASMDIWLQLTYQKPLKEITYPINAISSNFIFFLGDQFQFLDSKIDLMIKIDEPK